MARRIGGKIGEKRVDLSKRSVSKHEQRDTPLIGTPLGLSTIPFFSHLR